MSSGPHRRRIRLLAIIAIPAALALTVGLLVGTATADDTVPPIPPSDFCKQSGLTPHDGTQLTQASCSSLVQGEIPGRANMPSVLITRPAAGLALGRSRPTTFEVRVSNLETGFFSDPAVDLYQVPQGLSTSRIVQGHVQLSVQRLDGQTVPDPTMVVFYKDLTDPFVSGTGSATIPAGTLTAGRYRFCAQIVSESHQPVLRPVLQAGPQVDCVRVTVVR